MSLRKGTFTIDGIGTFDGYTKGETWNGWSCPYFAENEAKAIIESLKEDGTPGHLNSEKQIVILHMDDGFEEPEVYHGEFVQGCNEILYPIGAYEWVWDEETEEQPTETLEQHVTSKDLREFRQHLDATLNEFLSERDEGLEYNERFDVKIGLNRKEIHIPLHADCYSRLERFIDEEIEENEQ